MNNCPALTDYFIQMYFQKGYEYTMVEMVDKQVPPLVRFVIADIILDIHSRYITSRNMYDLECYECDE